MSSIPIIRVNDHFYIKLSGFLLIPWYSAEWLCLSSLIVRTLYVRRRHTGLFAPPNVVGFEVFQDSASVSKLISWKTPTDSSKSELYGSPEVHDAPCSPPPLPTFTPVVALSHCAENNLSFNSLFPQAFIKQELCSVTHPSSSICLSISHLISIIYLSIHLPITCYYLSIYYLSSSIIYYLLSICLSLLEQ